MGYASKGMLVLRPVHAADRKLSPVREPSVSHVATGPIVLRRDSNPHYSEKKTEHPTVKGRSGVADTMLEKRFCSDH